MMVNFTSVPNKPLSAGEREQLTQRMKECKRVLANLRYMKHNAGPAAAKQRQTIRRQLVQVRAHANRYP
jgi:ribosomal protein L29